MPLFVSTEGYGVLFDCCSLMTFNDEGRESYLFLDTVDQIDYYFMGGHTMDEIIHDYRYLTGKAQMLRAVLEGICFHQRWMLECEERKTKTAPVIRFVGGGALSKVTCQMLADITGRTVETVENTKDVGAIGAVMLAAVGSGLFPSLTLAAAHVKVNGRYEPNAALKPVYDRNYRVFRQLYASNKKNFALLNKLKEA